MIFYSLKRSRRSRVYSYVGIFRRRIKSVDIENPRRNSDQVVRLQEMFIMMHDHQMKVMLFRWQIEVLFDLVSTLLRRNYNQGIDFTLKAS